MDAQQQIVPDTEHRGLILRLPQPLRDLALLARFDRPIGWWLLFWPCAWGLPSRWQACGCTCGSTRWRGRSRWRRSRLGRRLAHPNR